jgi:hypothetical protein
MLSYPSRLYSNVRCVSEVDLLVSWSQDCGNGILFVEIVFKCVYYYFNSYATIIDSGEQMRYANR